jgi:hypothetical protein
MHINFLIQIIKILHNRNYNENDLKMAYEYLIKLDNKILNDYFKSNLVLSYNNDLEFCIEIMEKILYIYEDKEEYEKCQILKNKIDWSKDITKLKLKEHECT